MAEINFGLIDTQSPARIANALMPSPEQQGAQALQVMQMQHAAGQNELAKYTLAQAKRSDELQNKMLAGLQGATTIEQQAAVLRSVGKVKEAQELLGSGLTQRKTLGEITAQDIKANQGKLDAFGAGIAPLAAKVAGGQNITHDDVFAVANQLKSQGLLDDTNIRAIPMDARQLPSYVMGLATATENARKALETHMPQALVAGGSVINKNPLAAGGIGNVIAPVSMTPFETARLPILQQQANAQTTQAQTAQGQLRVAQARLKLAQEAPKHGLTNQEDIDAVALAVASERLPVDRVNSVTAPLFAKLLKVNPDLDFTKLSNAQAGAKASAVSNARIEARQTLTDVDATQAENIARGNLPPATGPNAGKIMNEVVKLNPEYNSRDFGLQTAAEKEFNIGKNGNKTRSLNVAVSHLTTLDTAAVALRANDVRAFNEFKQAWQRETGKSAPTDFNAVRELVADEIVAAVVPGVGALADRKALKDTIVSKSSPEQLQGVVKYYKELLGGQLGGLETQYKASTGKTDFRQRYLTPEAIAALTPGQKALPAGAAKPAGVGPNWTFETDAKGNSAWVSPDRKSFKEAQ